MDKTQELLRPIIDDRMNLTAPEMMDAIIAALESRPAKLPDPVATGLFDRCPAPTEERAREVLAEIVEADDRTGGARPTSPLGKTAAYYIRDGQGATITAWQAIRAMLRFASAASPARDATEERKALRRLETAATLATEWLDRINDRDGTALGGPQWFELGRAVAQAREVLATETHPVAGGEQ